MTNPLHPQSRFPWALSIALSSVCLACGGGGDATEQGSGGSTPDGGGGQSGSPDGGGSGGTAGSGTGGSAGSGGDAGPGGTGGGAGQGGTGDDDGGADCPTGLTLCGSSCVDLDLDPAHCGDCDEECPSGESCCEGSCKGAVGGDAPPLAALDACGRLVYGRYANEGQTWRDNTLPDFSYAGYERGGVRIPDIAAVRTVSPASGDDRARIQQAIDEVAAMPIGADGFRGAVLLEKGEYQIAEPVGIRASGIVLRGEGQGAAGTVIRLTATKQSTAIEIAGSGSGLGEVAGSRTRITSSYVGVGSRSFDVESAAGFQVGDDVALLRTPNQAWIDDLGMGPWGWTASGYEVAHERRVLGLEGNRVTVDIPVVDTVQDEYGGGYLFETNVTGRIRHCGVEDLRLVSAYAGDTDEEHGWTGVSLERTTDSWVRRVTVQYFGYSAVLIESGSNFNTVEDTAMIDPKSQITGGRRYPFQVAGGLGNLFQRCYARDGRHNFVTGSRVTGPNVWLDCLAESNHADDGPHHRWATGLLFDNTNSEELRVQNREDSGTGHGWAGAQVLFWNVKADSIVCDAPKGAMSWAVGAVGQKTEGSWAPEEPEGLWESEGQAVTPRSLYLQQLRDRLGQSAVENVTAAAQRQGRIWTALSAWAGEGRLADYY